MPACRLACRCAAPRVRALRQALTTASLRAQDPGPGDGAAEDAEPEAQPPVPIDVCVRPGTRCVIITGPNTGDKTATIKVPRSRGVPAWLVCPSPWWQSPRAYPHPEKSHMQDTSHVSEAYASLD